MTGPTSTLRAAYYWVETMLVAPGIVAHELAHVVACRLTGVAVHGGPVLNPFGRDAYVEHERVDSFPADLAIALAPLVLNTALAAASLAIAFRVSSLVLAVPLFWVGGSTALTAFPSVGDTETLYDTARGLPWPVQPLAFLLAVPVRLFTALPGSAGFAGFLWLVVLLAWARPAFPA